MKRYLQPHPYRDKARIDQVKPDEIMQKAKDYLREGDKHKISEFNHMLGIGKQYCIADRFFTSARCCNSLSMETSFLHQVAKIPFIL